MGFGQRLVNEVYDFGVAQVLGAAFEPGTNLVEPVVKGFSFTEKVLRFSTRGRFLVGFVRRHYNPANGHALTI